MKRISQKTLDALPTKRLYVSLKHFFALPYQNATEAVELTLKAEDFRPDKQGLPWACGISRAIQRQHELFNHPVHWVYTIDTTTYVTAILNKGSMPRLLIRYNHKGGVLAKAYDESRGSPKKWRTFLKILQQHPVLILEAGRTQAGRGTHSPGSKTGHRRKGAPNGDKNKENLRGHLSRAQRAGFVPAGLSL